MDVGAMKSEHDRRGIVMSLRFVEITHRVQMEQRRTGSTSSQTYLTVIIKREYLPVVPQKTNSDFDAPTYLVG